VQLNYKKLGEEGTPLIILHGFLGSLDNWFSLGKRFADKHQVYLLDARNHGLSPHSDEFSYDAMVEDLKEFIEQEKLENVILLGHSMGGKIVMKFALDYPSIVKKLIVVDIAPKEYPVHHDEILDALKSLEVSEIQSRKEADKALAEHISEFGIRQFLLKNLDRQKDGSFQWKMNLPVLDEKIEEVGQEISGYSTVDALFIRGEKSNYIREKDENDILEIFPSASFASLPTGHWVHAEDADGFFEVVSEFLDS